MPGKWDYNQITQIQQANDIIDVISEHLNLEKKGKEMVGLCPFHTDHRPSMYVNPEKQIFKCFACGAGGDVLKFVQMRENLTFPQAVERLAHRAGITIRPVKSSVSQSGDGLDANHLAKLNKWAMKQWIANLNDPEKGASAREYLAARNISVTSMEQWSLGLAVDAWDDLIKTARQNKGTDAVMIKAGLAVERDRGGCYDKFRNRLMFPIIDVTGRVIGFGGRTLGDDPAKYMNSPATALFDKSHSLYGLDQARETITETGTAVVVEGYTDVMMAHQFGVTNVVATLGTSLTTGHAHTLRRYAKRIVLIFDSDVAGKAAAERAVDVCLTEQVDIRVAFVPSEKDPCEYLLEAGTEAFKQVIELAQDVLEFKWALFEERLAQGQNLADRTEAIRQFLQTVAAIFETGKLDSIARNVVIGRLAELLRIQPSQISDEINKIRQRKKRRPEASPESTPEPVEGRSDLVNSAEREILEALLKQPELYADISGNVNLRALFSDRHLQAIATAFADVVEQGGRPELSALYSRIEETETSGRLNELYESAERKANPASRLRDCLATLEQQQQRHRTESMKEQLSDQERFKEVMELIKQSDNVKRRDRKTHSCNTK